MLSCGFLAPPLSGLGRFWVVAGEVAVKSYGVVLWKAGAVEAEVDLALQLRNC